MKSLFLRRITWGSVGLIACSAIASGCSSKSNDNGPGVAGAAGFAGYPVGGAGAGGVPVAAGGMGAGGAVSAGGTTVVGTGGVIAAGGTTVVGTGGLTSGGTTGIAGAGGTTGAAGATVSIGGQSNGSDIKIVGSTALCMGAMPVVPSTPVSECTAAMCTGAHCIPMAQIPMGTDVSQLAMCPDGTYCTPDDYIATQGKFLVKTCTSLEGAEGRCISTCIPQVAKQIDQLPKDVCMDSERCAPCFNPIDGSNTHACTQGCDPGPTNTTPVLFAKCGIDPKDSTMTPKGLCVPKSVVPMDLQGIPQDTCPADHLCAPTEKVKDINYNFPMCMPGGLSAIGLMKNMAGQAGGCVPPYLAGSNSSLLVADVCTGGDLCAPCVDPTKTPVAPTGACPWP
ncbi:MAG TPA: hypothetical protein VHC69_33870 [Polyangiaceae bacterium]|nr:hypothetical protein [Polyangiaceae bacterium]HVW30410.1 hypothetical protein [Polyangiaceae bacterium]